MIRDAGAFVTELKVPLNIFAYIRVHPPSPFSSPSSDNSSFSSSSSSFSSSSSSSSSFPHCVKGLFVARDRWNDFN